MIIAKKVGRHSTAYCDGGQSIIFWQCGELYFSIRRNYLTGTCRFALHDNRTDVVEFCGKILDPFHKGHHIVDNDIRYRAARKQISN